MLIPELLLETLEDLVQEDFLKFKWYLSMEVLDGCQPFPKSRLEELSRFQTVSKMMERYGGDSAVRLSIAVLRKMTFNGDADKLETAYAEKNSVAPSTSSGGSSPAAPPAAPAAAPTPATMSAEQGSVIIAPTVVGGTSGSWNITVNRS